jgi:hypothetical protein
MAMWFAGGVALRHRDLIATTDRKRKAVMNLESSQYDSWCPIPTTDCLRVLAGRHGHLKKRLRREDHNGLRNGGKAKTAVI